jgi:hypothetical protein
MLRNFEIDGETLSLNQWEEEGGILEVEAAIAPTVIPLAVGHLMDTPPIGAHLTRITRAGGR